MLMYLLLAVDAATIYEVAGSLLIAFFTGLFFKWGTLKKYRKRVLHLENEMLENHSRILLLEKRNAELERERIKMPEKLAV